MDSDSTLWHFDELLQTADYFTGAAAAQTHSDYYLMPGRLFAAAERFAITTVVGSGVVLCLWDSVRKVGGVAHFLLPDGSLTDINPHRYANCAGETLLRQMLVLGASHDSLDARILGGTQPRLTPGNAAECLGDCNVRAARRFLEAKDIPVVHWEVGGARSRKVVFHTDDGSVWAQEL